MEEFNARALRDKVAAGYKGGNLFNNLAASPARTVVNGHAPEVEEKLQFAPTPQQTMEDPWNSRRSK